MGKSPKIREPEFDPALGDFRHIFDIGLQVRAETKPARTSSGWYASGLGYCLRRQFLNRAGVPSTNPPSNPRTLWLGQTIEFGVLQMLRHSGLLLADGLHVKNEKLDVTGYIDFIFGGVPVAGERDEDYSPEWQAFLDLYKKRLEESYPAGVPITGVELKSAAQYSAEKMAQEGPGFHHQIQGGTYKLLTDTDPSLLPDHIDGVNRWQIIVAAKSDVRMLVFPVLDSYVEKAAGRLEELNDAWPNELPACTCGVDLSWEKAYCPYLDGESCCNRDLILKAPEEFWALTDPNYTPKELPA